MDTILLKKGKEIAYYNPETEEFEENPSFHCSDKDLEKAKSLTNEKKQYHGGELNLITLPNYELDCELDYDEISEND